MTSLIYQLLACPPLNEAPQVKPAVASQTLRACLADTAFLEGAAPSAGCSCGSARRALDWSERPGRGRAPQTGSQAAAWLPHAALHLAHNCLRARKAGTRVTTSPLRMTETASVHVPAGHAPPLLMLAVLF